jgi:hypothetical protein
MEGYVLLIINPLLEKTSDDFRPRCITEAYFGVFPGWCISLFLDKFINTSNKDENLRNISRYYFPKGLTPAGISRGENTTVFPKPRGINKSQIYGGRGNN